MDREFLLGGVLLSLVLAIGLFTAADYGITSDEFIFDNYGPKALAWYASGFSDRSQFTYYDAYLYGPWFQILVAAAQSLHLADPFAIRHALTFLVGLAGIAALLPIGRLAVGRWSGLAAVVLCLITGNLYGHLFFTPNDVPFMAAMTWALLAILLMARSPVPAWPATLGAGLLTGLAIATRFGGVLGQAYLLAAMSLGALECWLSGERGRVRALLAITARTIAALALAWLTAIALWPWLQTGNPFIRFKAAYEYFVSSYVHFEFPHWGERVWSNALPWHYIPGQLLARLPELFIVLLVVAAIYGVWQMARLAAECSTGIHRHGLAGLRAPALSLAQARPLLIVTLAALGPAVFVVARGSVIFDGLRHLLFILPALAMLAAWALLQLAPLVRRFPLAAGGAATLQAGAAIAAMAALHPLEYVAMNSFVGGTPGAVGRFDLDYWGAAATEAVRRLERLQAVGDHEGATTPRVMVCINWRESMVQPMLPRSWIMETDPHKADFIVETERWPCGDRIGGRTIDRVQRSGVTFATTIETRPRAGRAQVSNAAPPGSDDQDF